MNTKSCLIRCWRKSCVLQKGTATRNANTNGAEHRDGWRPKSLVAEYRRRSSQTRPDTCTRKRTRNMVAEKGYEPREITSGAQLRITGDHSRSRVAIHGSQRWPRCVDHPTSLPRCDQDEKRWFQNSSPLPESLVLGKRDLNS